MTRMSTHGNYEKSDDRKKRQRIIDATNARLTEAGVTWFTACDTNSIPMGGLSFPPFTIQVHKELGGWQLWLHLPGGPREALLPCPYAIHLVLRFLEPERGQFLPKLRSLLPRHEIKAEDAGRHVMGGGDTNLYVDERYVGMICETVNAEDQWRARLVFPGAVEPDEVEEHPTGTAAMERFKAWVADGGFDAWLYALDRDPYAKSAD